MDRRLEDVETDSTVDYTLPLADTSDPDVQFRALAHSERDDQRHPHHVMAGDDQPLATGLRTDVDARPAPDPLSIGHLVGRSSPLRDFAVTPPSAAAEASTAWRGTAYSTPYPVEVTHYGPHPTASGAVAASQSVVMGGEFGCFVGQSTTRPEVERTVVSNWGVTTPTTTAARTNTATTLTSTYVTCSTVGGPVQSAHLSGIPHPGPMAIHPASHVIMPQYIERPGNVPGVLAGPARILRPAAGTLQDKWGEASTRSSIRPDFDTFQVANRPTDRAVVPVAPGDRYLGNGFGGSPVLADRSDAYSQGSHGARPKATPESQRMDPAGTGTGSTDERLVNESYVYVADPQGIQGSFQSPDPSSSAHRARHARTDVQSTVASAQSPETQRELGVNLQWVPSPSNASGTPSLPSNSDVDQTGFYYRFSQPRDYL